jgi:GDPmannose 4,6-dehydratase
MRALVTGAAGQDGSYLTELLLERDYEVVGVVRDPAAANENLGHVRDRVTLVGTDLLDAEPVAKLVRSAAPDEVYSLAFPSFPPRAWEEPVATARFAAVGTTVLLEALRPLDGRVRLFLASSAAIFGEPAETPQRETTPVAPSTPYGAAKAYAHHLAGSYRRRYGLHASVGILFNHESPRRPLDFLPSKVAHAVAAVSLGRETELLLGDLHAERDWGYAPDTVEAMWRMLRRDEPDDYVVATGESHSVAELVELAFTHVGLDWRDHVRVDESLKRGKSELHRLVGDASKARRELGWAPSVDFPGLVALLVDAALERIR